MIGITTQSVLFSASTRAAVVAKKNPVQATQGSLDASFLGAAPVPTPSPASRTKIAPKPKAGSNSKKIALDDSSAPSNEASKAASKAGSQAVETINSLTLILKTMPAGVSRNRVLLNRAVGYNLYAREKILASKNSVATDDIKKYLNASLRDVSEVLASPAVTAEQKWRGHDLAGVSALYLDQAELSKTHFLEVLKLNPPPEKAGRIGFMMAEDLFDSGKFKEASTYYIEYFSKMPLKLKELAIYKLAWCRVNLNQFESAEKELAKVARLNSTSGIGKDAIRDLAYLVTNGATPDLAIKRVEALILQPTDRLAFLYDVAASLESQGSISLHTQVVARILAVEKSPEKRLELSLANLRIQKTYFASKNHMDAFLNVVEALTKYDKKEYPAVFAKYESSIEIELQNLTRAYVDTYAGRVKTPEPLTKVALGEALKTQFMFYHSHFSAKPSYSPMVGIWRDICLDLKDWVCVDTVSQIVIAQPTKLQIYSEKAYLDQIAALDQFLISPTKTEKQKSEWTSRRELRIKEFVEKFPQSTQWIQVAKFYTASEVSKGHEKLVLPTLEKIMVADPSDESFYRLQYARFKLGSYNELLSDPRGKKYIAEQSKVVELYRECSLILAQKAKDAGNVDQYRIQVNQFIGFSADADKARIARIDFYTFLIKRGLIQNAKDEYFALARNEYSHPDYEAFRVDLWKAAVETGSFDLSLKVAVASESITTKADDWKQRKIFSNIFNGSLPVVADLIALGQTEREYFLGITALTKPSFVIDYLKKKKPLTATERDLLELSFRIHLDQWQLERTAELEAVFGREYPFSEKGSLVQQPIEKNISAVLFPELAKMNPKKQTAAVQGSMEKTRELREKVLKAIEGKPLELQLRALEASRNLESKMAEYLISSPTPTELVGPQIDEYKAGIKEAASEFVQQSQQFEILAAKVREEVLKGEQKIKVRVLPEPEMERWVWPTGAKQNEQLKWVFDLLKNGNQLGALALTEYLRPTFIKSDEDFFSLRYGILLSHKPSEVLRLYLLDDLERNKRFLVLRSWAAIVKMPVPGELK